MSVASVASAMRATPHARTLLLSVLLGAFGPASVSAQGRPFIEWAGEFSPVRLGVADTTWHTARLAAGIQDEGRFGWMLAAERQQRGDLSDWVGQASGFRRAGAWTLSGAVGATAEPRFLYRRSIEGELARIVGRGFVAHGAYRNLRFRDATVHVMQPAVSWYLRGHELQARGFFVRNTTRDDPSTTLLLRGSVEASPRIRLAAGAAVGSRIFDVTAVGTGAEGWVVFGFARIAVTRRLSVVVGAGGAHEEPLFEQRTVSLGARWTFQ